MDLSAAGGVKRRLPQNDAGARLLRRGRHYFLHDRIEFVEVGGWVVKPIRHWDSATRYKKARHRRPPAHERARYRCFLPDLAGLAGKRRAGPMPDTLILARMIALSEVGDPFRQAK